MPGAHVTLLHHQVLDGIFELQVGDKVVRLAAEGLAGLFAEPATPQNNNHSPGPKNARRKGMGE